MEIYKTLRGNERGSQVTSAVYLLLARAEVAKTRNYILQAYSTDE